MTTFVLLHGGWHGGWCWRFVAPALRHAGHNVYTPTLTGLGEREHLARPEIDLKLHVQDVVALLEMEDLQDIVLLGHSYGGMVVTGVADRCAARISRLVYLDAFVPENGKCALDYIVPERSARAPPQNVHSLLVARDRHLRWIRNEIPYRSVVALL
jgi:pimeloyl-ACP methyl ester carboxylesterase